MKETQRRLLRHTPGGRTYLAATGALGVAVAAVVVTQASLLAWVLARGFTDHARPAELAGPLTALAAVLAVRAVLAWGQGALAQYGAAAVKARLRTRLLARTQQLGPVGLARWRAGEVSTLATRGLDALDPYFTGYLPKLVAAAVVPVAVIVRLAVADWGSALIVVVTLPLIPVFAALVGAHTRDRTARQWGLLSRLGGHFHDVVAGLPTLRAFGRARHQVEVVHRMADVHRAATMRTLRVAFLSSLVLELVATLSVALVAVPLGLRLMGGGVDLSTALLVLFLAPEAYLPLRAAGAAFHDSAEGVAVAERTFAVLDGPAGGSDPAGSHDTGGRGVSAHTGTRSGHGRDTTSTSPERGSTFATRPPPDPAVGDLRLDRVTARYPDRDAPALREVSLRVRPGERVALVGPSGAGKSTLLALLLGFVTPEAGRVSVGDAGLTELDRYGWQDWRSRVAWVPQRPHLFAGTVADNIRLGNPDAPLREVREAARAAAADGFITALPGGYDAPLGERGAGVSAGQRQRIALARAFLRDAPLLLLDEPTAHLDPASETAVAEASARLLAGRSALVVAHRPALLPHVDRVVTLRGGRVATPDSPARPAEHEAPRARGRQFADLLTSPQEVRS